MPVTDRLLTAGMLADLLYGEVYLDETLGILGHENQFALYSTPTSLLRIEQNISVKSRLSTKNGKAERAGGFNSCQN